MRGGVADQAQRRVGRQKSGHCAGDFLSKTAFYGQINLGSFALAGRSRGNR
jgi:hypothetical protein